ncbi:hypothetical protein F5Y19DRAFT_112695 [Xylariaceae sp. FL1651]|nr:hypothetical protein F5Y19DRAFT_112695 [Xylariaceae sp. FL1651]
MNRIPRKPIAHTATQPPMQSYDHLDDLLEDYLEPHPPISKTPLAAEIKELPDAGINHLGHDLRSPLLQRQKSAPILVSNGSQISVASSTSVQDSTDSSRSRWKSIVDETVYFAGGLVSHPFESTKHYSVLRHSSALVYYRGPSTSVTISVFGDAALPPDRTFWLQRKGFSGNMGMAASALMRTTSNWIDVTPSVEASASGVPEGDERAWQRDIKKFRKRASKDKRLSKHVVRATCVLRIPAVAEDGYLRIVMCTGQNSKKTLCPSPTFRLASTSSDVSVMRGASLTTLPLEVGLKVASVVGNQYVQRVAGPAYAVVQSKIKKIQPSIIANNAGKLALATDVMKEQFGTLEENYDAARDAAYDPFHEEGTLDEPPDIVGSDSGPAKPFPISLHGKVVPGTGQGLTQTGTPTANLSDVAEDLLLRLNGIYIGWAAIQTKGLGGNSYDWHEAIITIGPSPYASPRVVAQNVATVHIIHDFGEGATFFGAKLKIMIMALMRPVPKPNCSRLPADIAAAVSRDRVVALASLSREKWQYEMALQMLSYEKSQKTTAGKYIDFRSQVQKRMDNIPTHWAGIRTDRTELKDGAYGRGGFYIQR